MQMMSLGTFVFATDTVTYQAISRKRDWNFTEKGRFAAREAIQFTSIGADTIILSGVIYTGKFGHLSAIEDLAKLADSGEQHPLIDSSGVKIGEFIIKSLGDDGSYLLDNGKPRKVDFTIEIKRVE